MGGRRSCLVPEISLTPQTVERFRLRFGEVAVLHSHLSDAERHWHWQQIAAGGVQVVVGRPQRDLRPHAAPGPDRLGRGTRGFVQAGDRSAVSCPRRGLARAEAEEIPLVLGSATPSLESWHRAAAGRVRVGRDAATGAESSYAGGRHDRSPHRPVRRRTSSSGAISRHAASGHAAALDDDGQVILLLNRRGFSDAYSMSGLRAASCGAPTATSP